MSRRLFLAVLLLVVLPITAEAATLWVATNGVDTSGAPECGKLTSPCRSINKAIALANPGDMIIVFPGRYGPESEAAPAPGCVTSCLINVNKRVTLTSRDGGNETIIDGGGAVTDVVEISANSVAFGKKLKGFSLVNGGNGLNILPGVTGVSVTGNSAGANTAAGFEIDGDNAVVSANRSGGNGFSGFSIRGTGHEVMGNLAAGNAPHGFAVFDSGHTLSMNLAYDNPNGFTIAGANIVLTGNVAIGNSGPGVDITSGAGTVSVTKGSIFGNDFTGGGCGLVNESPNTVDATGNFWGAATGPGPDPADIVCDTGGGQIVFAPFSKKEINPKAP